MEEGGKSHYKEPESKGQAIVCLTLSFAICMFPVVAVFRAAQADTSSNWWGVMLGLNQVPLKIYPGVTILVEGG